MNAKQLAEKILALPEDQQLKTVAVYDHSGLAIVASRLIVRNTWLVSAHYTRLPNTEVLLIE